MRQKSKQTWKLKLYFTVENVSSGSHLRPRIKQLLLFTMNCSPNSQLSSLRIFTGIIVSDGT